MKNTFNLTKKFLKKFKIAETLGLDGDNYLFVLKGTNKLYTGLYYYSYNDERIYIIENGQLHNVNGPAIIYSDGSLEYCINDDFLGKNLSNQQLKDKIKEQIFK